MWLACWLLSLVMVHWEACVSCSICWYLFQRPHLPCLSILHWLVVSGNENFPLLNNRGHKKTQALTSDLVDLCLAPSSHVTSVMPWLFPRPHFLIRLREKNKHTEQFLYGQVELYTRINAVLALSVLVRFFNLKNACLKTWTKATPTTMLKWKGSHGVSTLDKQNRNHRQLRTAESGRNSILHRRVP